MDYTKNSLQRIADGGFVKCGDIVFEAFNDRIRKVKLPEWNSVRSVWGLTPEYFIPRLLYKNFPKAKAALLKELNVKMQSAVTDHQREQLAKTFNDVMDLDEGQVRFVDTRVRQEDDDLANVAGI